jgi:hypothetical protein
MLSSVFSANPPLFSAPTTTPTPLTPPAVRVSPPSPRPLSVNTEGKTYDLFLTHNWGKFKSPKDGEEVENHDRVSKIYHGLTRLGLACWFDEVEMDGIIIDKMCAGIKASTTILVCVTERYIDKVGGANEQDNCKKEFNFAEVKKGGQAMIPVLMDPKVSNTKEWEGPVCMVLASKLYVDFSDHKIWQPEGHALFDAKLKELHGRVVSMVKELGQTLVAELPPVPPVSSTNVRVATPSTNIARSSPPIATVATNVVRVASPSPSTYNNGDRISNQVTATHTSIEILGSDPSSGSHPKCQNGHTLESVLAGSKPTGYNSQRCDHCRTSDLHRNGRVNYHCPQCKYDMCYTCAETSPEDLATAAAAAARAARVAEREQAEQERRKKGLAAIAAVILIILLMFTA